MTGVRRRRPSLDAGFAPLSINVASRTCGLADNDFNALLSPAYLATCDQGSRKSRAKDMQLRWSTVSHRQLRGSRIFEEWCQPLDQSRTQTNGEVSLLQSTNTYTNAPRPHEHIFQYTTLFAHPATAVCSTSTPFFHTLPCRSRTSPALLRASRNRAPSPLCSAAGDALLPRRPFPSW